MADKFRNTYRTESTRLQNWDYGSNAAYFVTICTAGREHYFGDIVVHTPKLGVSELGVSDLGVCTMQLSEMGKIAQKYWLEIPDHFPFVELENFVIMPNHVHGIIVINKNNNHNNVDTPNLGVSTPTTVSTTTPPIASATDKKNNGGKNDKWKPATLGVIINQYKRMVTINARKIHAGFAWQSRFYDHIIRNDKSFQNIQKYIQENPQKWATDKFNLL